MKTFNPLYSKRGGLGVLALFCSLFVLVLLTFLFWPGSELVAKPTDIVESAPEVVLKEPDSVIIPVISGNITKTVAVSFDEPRPKISPELVKELKELKRDRKRAKVLINVRDDAALVALQKTVSDAGGQITQSFSVGDVAVVDLPADKVEEVSQAVGVEEISVEREYVAFLFDRIPVFGVDKVWESNITGKNVKIAVLDTGVGPHDNISVYGARSFVSGEDTADLNGHGTHVAGIAQGVARGAQIYNAKVLSRTGSGSTSQIIAGINWAADNDVDIISMSFGGMFTELDGPLASAVKDAIQRGVVFVVASGNCRQGCGGFFGVTTPGNVKEVITVGAVDDGNVVASFSSGDAFSDYIKPDITAPGKDITSTWLNNGWKTLSGTSMSTPFVSGVVALMLEKESLTHSQVKAKLEGTAIDLGTAGKDTSYGAGLVNVSWLISVVVNVTINQTNATNVTNTTIPVNETIPVPVSNETEPAPANATRPAPVSFDTESRLVTGDVGVFAFTGMNNASFVREGSISDKIAFYAKENSTIFVEELLFDNIFNYSEYLYQNIPLTSDNLTFINGDNNYIEYENRYLWYNDYALYLVDAYLTNESELIDFLDDYSLKTSNNVGKDFDDNLENLKLLDNRLFSAISLSNAQTSSKSEDFDPQWGGSGTSSAAQLYFGKTEPETFWSKSYNWYKASTTRMSTLSFEIINIDSGDDLDLYVYDYTGTYLLCHSDNTGNANEKCPVSKTVNTNWLFYIVIYPYTIGGTYAAGDIKLTAPDCSVTWVGNAECSTTGNDVLKNKQKTDCTTAKEVYDDCDRLTGSGTPYCSGGDAVRTDTTGYCSSGSCRSSSSTVTDDTCTSDEKCSGGVCVAKTCIDYSSNQGSCGWSNYNALDSTECINGNAVDCDRYGGIYCWKNLDICTSDEECHNPPTSSAHCDVIPCTVSSVSWDTTSAVVGSSVGITVQGSHCSNSNYVTFDVFENDCLGAAEYNESQIDTTSLNETGSNETNLTAQGVCNDAVNYRPSQAYFSSNRARTTWTAEYQSDGWGNPDYYAWAYLNGDTNDDTGSGNELTVTCGDSDVDGYSNSGGDCGNSDCNDGDANIHPGATERCNNIDDDCDGSRDEGIDLQTDANNCGSCGNACGSGGSCHDGQCYSTQCAGYADTIDGCSTKGEFKKDDEKIYKCNNMLWWGTLLCWEKVASKGDSNYCSLMTCSHGEYDCEDGQCGSNLVCDGHWIGSDGCCYPNTEEWDGYSNTCKKTDGQPCTDGNQCIGNYCVSNYCWNQPYKVGDTHCDANAGETCSNSPVDCKKCDGASCSAASECKGSYCVHNACWNANYKIGDGYCDSQYGESESNSPKDCFGQIEVLQITSYPSIVSQAETFTVKAKVKNIGTVKDTLKLEAGLYADSWETFTISEENYSSQYYFGIAKCCAGNDYFSAVQITLDPNQEQEVSFSIKAPSIHSVDDCNANKRTAWDSSHTLVVGLYNACGGGYVQYKAKDVKVRDRYCYSNSGCSANEVCNFNNGIPGICAVKNCLNECNTINSYVCAGSELDQCKDIDNDGCLELEYKDYCVGEYECVDGQNACSQVLVKKIRIDYSNGYTTVNKQPGDLLRLMVDYTGSLNLNYDSSAFTLNGCSAGTLSKQECKFIVNDEPGTYTIGIRNGPEVAVNIIKKPKIVIITDRAELINKFGDVDEVASLLMQAYRTAADDEGCVYDLKDYIG